MGALGTVVENGSWFDRLVDRANDFIQNAAYGTLTEHQKAQLVEEAAQDLLKASGGTVPITTARQKSQETVTQVLRDYNADPSQAGSGNWTPWLLGGLGALGLLVVSRT